MTWFQYAIIATANQMQPGERGYERCLEIAEDVIERVAIEEYEQDQRKPH